MAYLPQSEVDKEKKDQQGQMGQTVENNINSTGESGTVGAGAAGGSAGSTGAQASSQTPSGSAQGGTGYVNVQRYRDENQAGAQKMGQNFQTQMQNRVQQANQALQKQQQTFNEQSRAKEYNQQQFQNQLKDAAANQDQIQQTMQAKYQGPNSLAEADQAGFQDYQTKALKAAQGLDLSETASGRETLLRDIYQRPQYNRGSSALDQALLQTNQGVQQNLANLRNTTDLKGNLTAARDAAQARLADTKQSYASARDAALADLMSQIGTQTKGWDTALSDAQAQAEIDWDKYQRDHNTVDERGFIDRGDNALQYGNVMTDADRAQYEALRQLAQLGDDTYTGDSKYLNAATGDADQFSFDDAGYLKLQQQKADEAKAAEEAAAAEAAALEAAKAERAARDAKESYSLVDDTTGWVDEQQKNKFQTPVKAASNSFGW